MFVPYKNSSGQIYRVVISVDPHSKFILPYLGYELEKAETLKRKSLGKERTGKPRFEKEYCDNEDPWYDGRGHGFTIVDSPRNGTILEYGEIIEITRNLYKQETTHFLKNAQYDGFISYRREGGSDIAWTVKTHLELANKKVFLDRESIKEGRFDSQILECLNKSKNFILILSKNALQRCTQKDDWVRKEISEAISQNINIIPVIKDDFTIPNSLDLPEEIREIMLNNAVTINYEYFNACINKVLKFMK
jgi:hypothetical protein